LSIRAGTQSDFYTRLHFFPVLFKKLLFELLQHSLGSADQVPGTFLTHIRQIIFTHHAAIHYPNPGGFAVFALHDWDHVLRGSNINMIASVSEFRTLIYTGGEPLVRPDIFELLRHSQKAGLANIIATNGTLINEEMAFKLKDHGVVCNAISIDAANPDTHDMVRNKPGAFDLALRAIEATKKAGILLQINTTAMEYNIPDLPELIDFVDNCGAGITLMYQLVAVGRGEKIEKATLKKAANQYLSELIALKQKTAHTIIEPVAGPQYWPHLLEKNGIRDGLMLKLAGKVFHGCAAGRGFVYVKANGDVWPCPFVEVNAGNVRKTDFKDIYYESDVFRNLRNWEKLLKGVCGECNYKTVCGGCRGRALAYSGDYLAEDPGA